MGERQTSRSNRGTPMADKEEGHVTTKGGSVTWRTETLPNGTKKRIVVLRKKRGKIAVPPDPKPAGTPKGTE